MGESCISVEALGSEIELTYIWGGGDTSLIMVWLYAYHGQTKSP